MGASAEKMIDASATFVQQSYAKYLSGEALRYYFDVNPRYCGTTLRMLWLPLLHRGHWARVPEAAVHGARLKPPSGDANAPDLYLPLMGFCTYVLLCCVTDLLRGAFMPDVRAAGRIGAARVG